MVLRADDTSLHPDTEDGLPQMYTSCTARNGSQSGRPGQAYEGRLYEDLLDSAEGNDWEDCSELRFSGYTLLPNQKSR